MSHIPDVAFSNSSLNIKPKYTDDTHTHTQTPAPSFLFQAIWWPRSGSQSCWLQSRCRVGTELPSRRLRRWGALSSEDCPRRRQHQCAFNGHKKQTFTKPRLEILCELYSQFMTRIELNGVVTPKGYVPSANTKECCKEVFANSANFFVWRLSRKCLLKKI